MILQSKCIGSNLVYSGKQFMTSSRVHVPDLRSSVVLLLLAVFDAVLLIILFSTDGQIIVVWYLLYMWITSCGLAVILQKFRRQKTTCRHFVIKDMGRLKYFLEIEFAYTRDRMALSQRKYALDLLQETGLLRCKLETTPFDQSLDFWDSLSGRYRHLIGKLIYIRPNIAYIVGVLSQFMHKPKTVHW